MAKTTARTKRTTALAKHQAEMPASAASAQMDTISRFVLDPNVNIEKLERVIALQEHAQAEASRVSFASSLSQMQCLLPSIKKSGKIYLKGGTNVRNRYAKMGDDILPVIKPVMKQFGFSIRWKTEWPEQASSAKIVRVVGILVHELGWSEQSVFEAPVDTHDSRNYIQSLGSTIQYGRRYTMIDLLNLEMVDDPIDDDGQSATGAAQQDRQQSPKRKTAASDVIVSSEQLKRLYTIAGKAKRPKDEIKAWLAVCYNIDSSKEIRQADYEDIIEAIEKPGPLGSSRREPGEEG